MKMATFGLFICLFVALTGFSLGEESPPATSAQVEEVFELVEDIRDMVQDMKAVNDQQFEKSIRKQEKKAAKKAAKNAAKAGSVEPETNEAPIIGPVEPETTEAPIIVKNCARLQEAGVTESGVYTIYPNPLTPVQAYCDLTTDGGGWTVFLRRQDGSVDFYLNWDDYVAGFPDDKSGEYWLGLDNIRSLLVDEEQVLRIDMEDIDGITGYAKYNDFSIGPAEDYYRISVGAFEGNQGNSMGHSNGAQFSTKDKDRDTHGGRHCAATTHYGAWWHRSCTDANLNGLYYPDGTCPQFKGVIWWTWENRQSYYHSLIRAEMKMRPANYAGVSG